MYYSIVLGMPKKVAGAKIAFLDMSLMKAKMHLGVLVQIEDPEKLDAVRQRYIIMQYSRVSMTSIQSDSLSVANISTINPLWGVFI